MNDISQDLKLLLIEDSDADAGLLLEMLKDHPDNTARVRHARSMREAVAHLAAAEVDAIVLDIGLPDVDGIGAVQRVREAAPHAPLLVLTGRDDEALAMQSLHQGAQDYLRKHEVTATGLLRAARYAIERKALTNELRIETERAQHSHKRAQRAARHLAAQHEILQVTLQSIGDAVVRTDPAGHVTYSNPMAVRMIGSPASATPGKPVAEITRMTEACMRAPSPQPGACVAGALLLPENYELIAEDGTLIPIAGCIAPIKGHDGEPAGQVIVFRDVSAERAITEQLSHRAHHDALTGLPNRLLLGDRIDQAIRLAPRHGKKVAVLFLDLDGFKHINDTLGHPAGDLLLKSVARRLVGCVRASDTVCRQGGDEFVVLLSEVGQAEDAALSAQRILQTIGAPHLIEGDELCVTTSIGVGVYPDDGADSQALLKAADTAMYQAKANGRQRYQFFEPGMKQRAIERQSIA
jgi:diguanylate cyclase (GGDEF)-like protein